MKNIKTFFLLAVITFSINTMSAQEKSERQLKKEQKEKEKLAKEKAINELIDTKTFVFKAKMAQPTGTRSINLTTTYSVKFKPDLVDGHLPYFGRAYNAAYGGEGGITLNSKPEEYEISKRKKNHLITMVVKENNDTYRITLTVGFQGNTSLNISSNNRSPITYTGDIEAIEVED